MMTGQLLRLVFCLLIANCRSAPQSTPPSFDTPIWEREIVPDLGGIQRRNGQLLLDKNRAGLAFLSNQEILVYAVYRKSGELSARESPAVNSPFRLHVWVLDATSAEIHAQRDWGTRAHDSAVQATRAGVLVKTGSIVRLYSPDFAEVRGLPLSIDANTPFSTSVSWSGRTIIIDRLPPKSLDAFSEHFDVLDASSLRIRYSWDQSPPLYGGYSISDIGIVAATANGKVISYAPFGNSRWDVILDDQNQTCVGDHPALITDQTFLIHCKELTVLTNAGVSYSLPIDHSRIEKASAKTCQPYDSSAVSKTSVASDSPVVALALPVLSTSRRFLREPTICLSGLQVVGYDLDQRKEILALNVDPVPKNDYDFALSPDGSKVAILNDRTVTVYALPRPSTHHSDPGTTH
jgi:hypothetical protein